MSLNSPASTRRTWAIVAAFVALFILALFLDIPISAWAHNSGLAPWLKARTLLTHFIRFPGNFLEYTLPICLVILIAKVTARSESHSDLWTAPAIVLLAGIFSGINSLLKWMVGRIRPYHGVPAFQLHPFSRRLLDAEAGFSFPSGDASLAFAMAMSLTLVMPRFWPIWWTLAIIVGLERIAENAHYPSDVVAGAALGVGVALIANWFVRTLCRRISNKEQETSIPS